MRSSTVEKHQALACEISLDDETLSVELSDGRAIAAPLAWYPRLVNATAKERNSWRLIGGGSGIHWPDLDEDISVANLLAGEPSSESQASFERWLSSRKKPARRRSGG